MSTLFRKFKQHLKKKDKQSGVSRKQILRRNEILTLRTSEAGLLNNYNTIAALDYAAGFYTGQVFNDLRNGEITQEEFDILKENLEAVHKSRREVLKCE
jgi:hypothetical protein